MSEHFQPNWVSAPGGTVADILSERNLTVSALAKLLGCSEDRASRLVSGRLAITPEIAKRLANNLGGSVQFWLARESEYRQAIGRLQSTGDANAARLWLSELPVNDMIKLGWIKASDSFESKVVACLAFFGVPDVSSWRRRYADVLSAVAFRTSQTFQSEPGAVLAWLRCGEKIAEEMNCKPWHKERFNETLRQIRFLTYRKRPASFLTELQKLCADCGVAVAVVRAPKGCSASGATKFISPEKALIVLSFRYLSDDHFWFTFFHEAGHLILHDERAVFIEDESDISESEEREANNFATSILISDAMRRELERLPLNRNTIIRYSVSHGISRGIVVGQLQHMGRIAPNRMNWLKKRYKWDDLS